MGSIEQEKQREYDRKKRKRYRTDPEYRERARASRRERYYKDRDKAITQAVEWAKKNPDRVIHCHEKDKFRGWLCGNCNIGLGNFKDNVEILEKAIEYLKQNG